jgi:hypothetical protein
MKLTTLLRGIAVLIAILAIVDPTLSRSRGGRAVVALVSADPRGDSADLARVRDALDDGLVAVDGPFAKADASVIVGDALPAATEELAQPVFRVIPRGPSVSIEALGAPLRASAHSRLVVTPRLRLRGAGGRAVELTLRANGVAVATASVPVRGDDAHAEASLAFAPAAGANVALHLTASLGTIADSADALVDLTPRPWRVLFRDGRPSWTSTFVRRAIERDPRFEVASRIGMTSTLVSDAGRPPSLDNRAAIDEYDVVVLGAPGDARDLAAIEPYLRRRGGSVLLLPDSPTHSLSLLTPLRPLALGLRPEVPWSGRTGGPPLAIQSGRDSTSLRAIELTWPAQLPAGAEVIAWSNVARADTARRPIVWSTYVGAGHLVVSGALDAWRFRDGAASGFDTFWRDLIATEATRAPRAVEVTASPAVVAPGGNATIGVALRAPSIAATSASDQEIRADVRAELRRLGDAAFSPVRLWPEASVGTFSAKLSAPSAEGDYEVRVISGRDTAIAPLEVKSGARSARADASGVLGVFAQSTGGRAVTVDELSNALRSAINPAERSEPWNPMRNPWWILPFALLLSAEWWLRRRQGAP